MERRSSEQSRKCLPSFNVSAIFGKREKGKAVSAPKSGSFRKLLKGGRRDDQSPLEIMLVVEPKPAWKVLGARSKARWSLSEAHEDSSRNSSGNTISRVSSQTMSRVSSQNTLTHALSRTSSSGSTQEDSSAAVLSNRLAWEALGRRRVERMKMVRKEYAEERLKKELLKAHEELLGFQAQELEEDRSTSPPPRSPDLVNAHHLVPSTMEVEGSYKAVV
eukprot:CAMPEP_0117036096 /NCGR_PEP_ID=MMETSP0472-20121206/25595_1 /TAXON_ID=693140 ORGANISM="Tiarina fusus, Strain LIS" /NCGR_SAMPLE_ID=MMETSP0472 /ASSEMBLY_ACC=CAM_ASM_000603 /LENGTH=218 /DNA_ID=CAMNT_0004745761 /DNA_START=36 /DNA_END=692 /DNA_ORIENTATION=+